MTSPTTTGGPQQFDSQQGSAIQAITKWMDSKYPQVFRMFGYAGTGKTTIARYIYDKYPGTVGAAFTGKAAIVMQSKGMANSTTLHSLIYVPIQDEKTGNVTFVPRGQVGPEDDVLADCPLIIVDEGSMIYPELGKDLLDLGKKILLMGDPFQLPPIEGESFFMETVPDVMLTQVHRQAADSPIIRLSMEIRERQTIDRASISRNRFPSGGGISILDKREFQHDLSLREEAFYWQCQMIAGTNRTRRGLNTQMRQYLEIDDEEILPKRGEKLVCLRNDKNRGLFNGSMWTVEKVGRPRMRKIKPDMGRGLTDAAGNLLYPMDYEPKAKAGSPVVVNAFPMMVQSLDMEAVPPMKVYSPTQMFLSTDHDLDWRQMIGMGIFDFGYALTCHKAQGSQFDNVLLFNESRIFRDQWARWLYTGVTRAISNLVMVE